MGRGKIWSSSETMALVEAFIHISEDAITSNYQSGDQLYFRVAEEAKSRFKGDWMRSADACKKRWKDVSKEVQLFCAATKFVHSIEHSGWNDDDYFKAAVEYYVKNHKDQTVNDFKFLDEWKFLKDFEKWKTSQPTTPAKRVIIGKQDSSPNATASEESDYDIKVSSRPAGNKKARTLEAVAAKAEELFGNIGQRNEHQNAATQEMLRMMQANIEQSKRNCDVFKQVFETQTSKLTDSLMACSQQTAKTSALKALVKLDLSEMSSDFQAKAKKKIEQELESILEF
jgi:hypothetical protein